MKIKFEDKFEDKILSRGYDYYKNNLVQDVHMVDDLIVAKVIGSKTYKAFIQVEDDDLIEVGCSCPYASDRLYCKHIAALLYYLEENDVDESSKKYKNKRTNLRNIIKNIDKKELEKFLVDLLENDEDIRDKFRLKFNNLFAPLSLEEYKRKIRDAIRTSAGRDGFIDYQEAWDYTQAMYKITNEVDTLVDNGYYELAFDVTSSILDTIPDTNIDDSNGSTGEVANSCIEIIEKILNQKLMNDKKISMKILQYILYELKTDYLYNYGIKLYELLNIYIENNIYVKEIEMSLVSILKSSKSKDYFWRTSKYVEYLVEIYNIEDNQEKIMDLLKEYSYDREICFKLVDEYIKQNEVNKAIKILKEKLKETKSEFFAEKLSEIYNKENMTEEYKETLYKLLYELDKYNINVYKKIKKLFSSKDWLVERQIIIGRILKEKNRYFRDILNIYIEEKMYDDIFNIVKDANVDTIISYEEYLLPKYNKELINIYVKHCKEFAKSANNRRLYRELASYLRHIKNMEKSKDVYEKLMMEIRLQYRNKPAMQDELKGL